MGLANVRVDQLVLRSSDKLVGAATHGRGVFTTLLLNGPLATSLLDFEGHLQQNNIFLEWSTSSEANSNYFELEKSFNKINFHRIAKIAAAGNSNSLQAYSYLDREPPSEQNYYRLKMVDIDGGFIYSPTILIKNLSAGQNIWVLNNPFNTSVKLRFVKTCNKIQFNLISISGARLYHKEFESVNECELDFSSLNLARGTYFLQADLDGRSFTRKLIKD